MHRCARAGTAGCGGEEGAVAGRVVAVLWACAAVVGVAGRARSLGHDGTAIGVGVAWHRAGSATGVDESGGVGRAGEDAASVSRVACAKRA